MLNPGGSSGSGTGKNKRVRYQERCCSLRMLDGGILMRVSELTLEQKRGLGGLCDQIGFTAIQITGPRLERILGGRGMIVKMMQRGLILDF